MRLQNLNLLTAMMTAFYRLARSLPGIGLLLLSGLLFFPSALAAPCAPVDPFTGAMQVESSPLPHHSNALPGLSRHCLEPRAAPPLNETALDGVLTAGEAVQPQAAGSNWTATLRFDDLSAVAYGAGLHVAVGEDGAILTSPDGMTWTIRDSGTTADLNGITWGGGQFVAGGYGTILTSPDGVTWTERNPGITAFIEGITWGGGQYVAVGTTILTSPDGMTWTQRDSGTTYGLRAITWGGSQFVAVGDGPVLTSPDGVTWTARVSGICCYITAITWGGGQFVAVGYSLGPISFTGRIVTSPDGVTWTERTSGTTAILWALLGMAASSWRWEGLTRF